MSKKVLILSSSPRRGGNSDTLCDEFLRGAKDAGHQAEKVLLRDQRIGYCTGCGLCNRKPGTCSQQDDMAAIGRKMIDADVLVFATPVYFYTMSAQLKTMIDRCCPYYTQMQGKEVYFLLTAADENETMLRRTVESLRGFTEDCLPDAHERGILYGVGLWHKGDVAGTAYLQQAYEMGNRC